ATLVAWQIGSMEASSAEREFIEPEDIFIAICKMDEVVSGENVDKALEGFGDLNHLRLENGRLNDYFKKYNIDRTALRRVLRGYVGRRQHPPKPPGQPMHRSEACKQAFQRAAQRAQAKNSEELHCLFLLAALLDEPSPGISKAIQRS